MGRNAGSGGVAVVVVGSGVVGLTTATVLQESGLAVEIWADTPPEETTSVVAGATWFPYKVYPLDRVLEWARRSKPVFQELATVPGSGVAVRECLQLWREPVEDTPWWASTVPDLRRIPDTELPPGYRDSYLFDQPMMDMPVYLRYLTQRYLNGGGTIRRQTVTSLEEPARVAGVVVNCTGLRARELAGDTEMMPVRGQWVRVRAPGVDRCVADFDHPDGVTYIIPRTDSCVLGGTDDEHAWDTTPSTATAEAILERCAQLDPRVARAPLLEHRAGLRPVRPSGVSLRTETLPSGATCVHNYGHGGGGVTLSWGCAVDVESHVRAAVDAA